MTDKQYRIISFKVMQFIGAFKAKAGSWPTRQQVTAALRRENRANLKETIERLKSDGWLAR